MATGGGKHGFTFVWSAINMMIIIFGVALHGCRPGRF
jgi:hypothetical protein